MGSQRGRWLLLFSNDKRVKGDLSRNVAIAGIFIVWSVIIFLPFYRAPEIPALPVDGNGHLFKVYKLMQDGWKPWINDWYTGYPFLKYYPPLSYLVAAFFGKILGTPIRGLAITLTLFSLIGVVSLYKLTKNVPLSLLYPTLLAHSPIVTIEGAYPRLCALLAAPAFILGVELILEGNARGVTLGSMLVSIVLLTHHSALLPLVVLVGVLYLRKMPSIHNIVRVIGMILVLTAFFYVPFILDYRYSNFFTITKYPYLFEYTSKKLGEIVLSKYFLLMIPLLLTLFLSVRKTIGHLALVVALMLLATGYYSPVRSFYNLPLLSKMLPYRWLDVLPLVLVLGSSEVKRKLAVKIVAVALIIAVTLALPYSIGVMPKDYLELAKFLKDEKGRDWRFYVIPAVAPYSYLPALTDKLSLNGWYHEGNSADKEYSRMVYVVDGVICHGQDNHLAEHYLLPYATRFFITTLQSPVPEPYKYVGKIGKFRIYEANTSFFTPVDLLIVGKFCDFPYRYIYMPSLTDVPHGVSTVMYLGEPKKSEERILLEFVKEGGTLIVIPERAGKFLGTKSVLIAMPNVTGFAPFVYEGKTWYGSVFQGNLTPIIKVGNYTLIGFRDVGKGRIYFIGGNLLFHSLYWNSSKELSRIFSLVKNKNVSLGYKDFMISDTRFSATITSTSRATVIVSIAYYPYWKIYIDGKEVKVWRDYRTGLMVVSIPGGIHKIEGVYRDPFINLRYYSLLGWMLAGAYVLTKRKKTGKIKPMRPLSGTDR
ncbi:6-pyruvoyl-tetrahydropterin synthase-related protein [Pyrococcus kukulkanii]|uniref:6-pyruvoyl-tetrahydropterin synthase-related protein n=1 Tax=Pyrococcus kukulkanii TaxID=1609559 RepID=UPI00128EF6BE|nr:6-pyruvoyl-tetrahydropterin synthase-related protein [Pyrococcus kukulkanii]